METKYTPHLFRNESDISKNIDKEYFKTKKVVFCGLIRNNEEIIDHLKDKIHFLAQEFQDWHILIVENDSQDNTRQKLLEWVQQEPNHVTILGCGINAESCKLSLKNYTNHGTEKSRINKMSWLRNIYLDYIKNNPTLSQYDYVCMMDLDLYSQMFLDGIWSTAYCFKKDPTINVISSYGLMVHDHRPLYINTYYDSYAHRENGNKDMKKMDADFYMMLQQYPYDSGLRKVDSCFGGATFYRLSSLLQYNYEFDAPKDKYGETLCEHTVLNQKIGNVYMNPRLLHLIQFRLQDWDIPAMLGNAFYMSN